MGFNKTRGPGIHVVAWWIYVVAWRNRELLEEKQPNNVEALASMLKRECAHVIALVDSR